MATFFPVSMLFFISFFATRSRSSASAEQLTPGGALLARGSLSSSSRENGRMCVRPMTAEALALFMLCFLHRARVDHIHCPGALLLLLLFFSYLLSTVLFFASRWGRTISFSRSRSFFSSHYLFSTIVLALSDILEVVEFGSVYAAFLYLFAPPTVTIESVSEKAYACISMLVKEKPNPPIHPVWIAPSSLNQCPGDARGNLKPTAHPG